MTHRVSGAYPATRKPFSPEHVLPSLETRLELDFEQSKSNTTSQQSDAAAADLILPKQKEDIAGHCGDDNDIGQPLEAHEVKSQRIEKFVRTLRAFLNRSSSRDLKTLVDAGQKDKRPLLDRLEEAVADAEKRTDQATTDTATTPAATDAKEISEDAATTEERWKAEEMRNKIEKQM